MVNLKCAILAIGSELLEGSIVDTNSSFLAKKLKRMGITPVDIRLTPDDEVTLIESLNDLTKRYPLILTTGGLGPTFDDITAACLAKAAGIKLTYNEEAFQHLVSWLTSVNVEVNENHKRQCLLPDGADTFYNKYGTAFGFGVKFDKSYVISMPGVPHEMMEMFESVVTPLIRKKFLLQDIYNKDIIFANVPESDVDEAIIALNIPKDVECIINAGKGEVTVKLRSLDKGKVDEIALKLKSSFEGNFVAFNSTIAEALLNEMCEKGLKLSVAESCTGGLVSKMLTDPAGSSSVFNGGVVSYANSVKVGSLGVDSNVIDGKGAVSAETAMLMAKGVKDKLFSDISIAITGIAGPSGATDGKDVGTVFIAVKSDKNEVIKRYQFKGNRQIIRERAATMALFMALQMVRG